MEIMAFAVLSTLVYSLGKEFFEPKPDKSPEEKLGEALTKYLDSVKPQNDD